MRASGVALLLLLVLTWTVPAFAGRIHMPPGSPAEEESAQGRIQPPVGGAENESQQGRIHSPPGLTKQEDELALWELFLVWLQWRIMPPVG